MITKTTYVAKDGKEFADAVRCSEYEHDLDNTVYVVFRKDWVVGVYHSRSEAEAKVYGLPGCAVVPATLT